LIFIRYKDTLALFYAAPWYSRFPFFVRHYSPRQVCFLPVTFARH